MAKAIVYVLEPVQVNEQDSRLTLEPLHPRQFLPDFLFEPLAIEKVCKGIVARQADELGLELLAFADVAGNSGIELR